MKVGGHTDPPRTNYFKMSNLKAIKLKNIIEAQSFPEQPIIVHMYNFFIVL